MLNVELYALQRDFAAVYLEKIENATAEQQAAAITQYGEQALPEIVTRTDGINEVAIEISGPLSPAGPSPLARFFGFGGTGYVEIIAAANMLRDDSSVETVRVKMNTPGGTVSGMDQARQALESLAAVKNVIIENHGQISSAGYYLATAKNISKIVAMSPLAVTGSIGVIRAGIDRSEAMARFGVKQIKIISSNAPNKQADPTTEAGRKVHQNDVDAMERVFIAKVADGRGTSEQNVIDNFGKGGELIAQDPDQKQPDALKSGMIDEVITQDGATVVADDDEQGDEMSQTNNTGDSVTGAEASGDREQQTAQGGGQTEESKMDLNKLKAEHPALFNEAVAIGVTNERERVDAHLTMGKASGDMDLAVGYIADGTDHTAATNAKYMAAQMTKGAIDDRADESEGDLDTESTEGDADEHDKALADSLAELVGVENNG